MEDQPKIPPTSHPLENGANSINNDKKVSILEILLPLCETQPIDSFQADLKQKAISHISSLEKTIKNKFHNSVLEKAQEELKELALNGLDQDAIDHVIKLLDELLKGNYEQSSIQECLGWNLRLTLNQLEGKSTLLNERIQNFSKRILDHNYEIQNRTDLEELPSNKLSYFLVDKGDHKPFAILKSNPSPPTVETILFPYLPPRKAEGWELELIGYELDQISGLNHTPLTLGVYLQYEGKKIPGVIQEYIPNSKNGGMLHNTEGAKLLKSIPYSRIHSTMFSGIFKGITAGHVENYLFPSDEKTVIEIDLEEILPEDNVFSTSEKEEGLKYADQEIEKLNQKISEIDKTMITESEQKNLKKELEDLKDQVTKLQQRKAIIECMTRARIWILGFPQNNQPIDRAAKIAINHPALLPLLKQYQGTLKNISEEAWNALLSRLEKMQKICSDHLDKEGSITPIDLYFAIFGGESLWKAASEKKYPKIWTSNAIMGCPHPYAIREMNNPLNLTPSKRLEEPKDQTEKSKEAVNFYRIMEGLEPKTFE